LKKIKNKKIWISKVLINMVSGTLRCSPRYQIHEVMGVSSPRDITSEKRTLSRNILRMEISDPEQGHLRVVDVLGIFKDTTLGATTKNDMALVRDIVTGYIENPRSVMLTVMPANVNVAT
jgi:hypothetical protein